MSNKVVVALLGNRNSGKSSTWYKLFGRTVRTGVAERRLYLNAAEWIEVFLTSGSAEERKKLIKHIIPKHPPAVVLCSIQYSDEAIKTMEFFLNNRYDMLVIWLNPGYKDKRRYKDNLGLIQLLLDKKAYVVRMNGKHNIAHRSLAIRQFLYGWGRVRNLIKTDF